MNCPHTDKSPESATASVDSVMNIELRERTAGTVKIYFERASTPSIRETLPQKAATLEEALDDFRQTQLPGAASYGRTVWVDGAYVGDVWCYCIDPADEPNAMVSYCVFDGLYRSRGVATRALAAFLAEIQVRYALKSVGAFTYKSNTASIRVLEKNGFRTVEEFTEDGRLSVYLQLDLPDTGGIIL